LPTRSLDAHYACLPIARACSSNEGTGYDAQLKAITRTQELSKQFLGEGFIGFGPHAGAMDADTWRILNRPEIKLVWGYKPPAGVTGKAFVVERKINMENPTTKMNKDKFIEAYEKNGKDLEYISLQGHPNAWDDMFRQFKDVALYLK